MVGDGQTFLTEMVGKVFVFVNAWLPKGLLKFLFQIDISRPLQYVFD